MTYLEFFGGNVWLAWASLWLVWMILPLFHLLINILNRILRSINIALHGWPPEYLDGDGDFRKTETVDQEQ